MDITLDVKPKLQTRSELMTELQFAEDQPPAVQTQVKPEIERQAEDIVSKLLNVKSDALEEREQYKVAIRTIGHPIQTELAKQSQLLREPMALLIKDAEDGGRVAKGLIALQEQVNQINPNKFDFNMSGFRRLLAKIPGVGTPLSRWFARFQAVDEIINDTVASLKNGKAELERDNKTLTDDQLRMRKLTFQLQDYISLSSLLDQKLSSAVANLNQEDEQRAFLEEEILFPLKQRIIDLQQQLAVNQQGVLATEVIIRNNRELVTGVNRAMSVTITALNTAATLQVALQRQKKVLKGVQAVTETTNDLIAGTAEQLKTQGVEIQKQSSQAMLDINTLKKAFQDVETALKDISEFRRNALPEMANSIVEMNTITENLEKSIQKTEQGNTLKKEFELQTS
jgi:uncharacterized protein YaaN involved in tellurite resistance